MAQYRAYAVNDEGHIVHRFEFEAESDERALDQARTQLDGLDIEVWEHRRVVGKLQHRDQLEQIPITLKRTLLWQSSWRILAV